MSNKSSRMFWLALGYIGGGLVASLYGKKSGGILRREIKTAQEKGEGSFKVLADNFIAIHSNMIENLKEEIMTEDNIKAFNEHKEEVIEALETYKSKASVILVDLKKKGSVYMGEAQVRLEELYNEKIAELDKMKNLAPRKLQEIKRKLKATFDEIREEMEGVI